MKKKTITRWKIKKDKLSKKYYPHKVYVNLISGTEIWIEGFTSQGKWWVNVLDKRGREIVSDKLFKTKRKALKFANDWMKKGSKNGKKHI